MTHAIETLILGLLIGGVYALLASGLTLIFGVMNIINVAQGALLVLAGLLTFELWRRLGVDPIAAAVVTTPVMFAVGWAIYRLFIARIRVLPRGICHITTRRPLTWTKPARKRAIRPKSAASHQEAPLSP